MLEKQNVAITLPNYLVTQWLCSPVETPGEERREKGKLSKVEASLTFKANER